MLPIREDFIVITEDPLVTSDGRWSTAESGTNSQFRPIAAEAGHTGILRVRTSNAAGSFGRVYKAEALWRNGTALAPGINQVWFDDVQSFEWEARLPGIAGMAFKLGLGESIYLTRAAVFEFDTNVDNDLHCNTYGASGNDSTAVTMPSDGAFHVYRVDVSSAQVVFSIDGVTVATHTDLTEQPRGAAVTPYAAVFARDYNYKYLDLDRFELE